MKIYINVKQIGIRKYCIAKREFHLKEKSKTLKDLLIEIVTEEVKNFNQRPLDEEILPYLTHEEIKDQLIVGKVSFNQKRNPNKAELDKAIETALLAYEDGIFRVFVGEKEAGTLDEPLDLKEEDSLTFIRLTMLSGRMW